MVVSSRYYAHPAPRPRAGGAAPAAVRSGRREGFCCGRAKGGPVLGRPAGNLMCARPAKLNPPPRAAPLRGEAGIAPPYAKKPPEGGNQKGGSTPPLELLSCPPLTAAVSRLTAAHSETAEETLRVSAHRSESATAMIAASLRSSQ